MFAEGMVAVPNHNCDAWQPAGANGMQKGVPPRAMLSIIIECKSGNWFLHRNGGFMVERYIENLNKINAHTSKSVKQCFLLHSGNNI